MIMKNQLIMAAILAAPWLQTPPITARSKACGIWPRRKLR